MRTIMILAFMLIGMVGNAQERVSMDSVQVGDEIIFDKKCNGITDIYSNTWIFYPSSRKVNNVHRDSNGDIMYIDVINNEGELKSLEAAELFYYEKKKRLHFCR